MDEIKAYLAAGGKITVLPEVTPKKIFTGSEARDELVRQLQLGDKSLEDLLPIFGDESTIDNAFRAVRRKAPIYRNGDYFSLVAMPASEVSEFGQRTYSEAKIIRLISSHLLKNHIVLANNINWSGYECDLLAISPRLRAIEFEIKTSRKDFLKDAKKAKWHSNLPVHKHYYVLTQSAYSADLLGCRPCDKSGILLVTDNGSLRNIKKAVAISQDHMKMKDFFNVVRLINQRHWRNR